MAGHVEAAPGTFALHRDRTSSLVDGFTWSLGRAATYSASPPPVLDTNSSSETGFDKDTRSQTQAHKTTERISPPKASKPPSFSAIPPSEAGKNTGVHRPQRAERSPSRSSVERNGTQHARYSTLSLTTASTPAHIAKDGIRPRLMSLSQVTPLLSPRQDQTPATTPTTATTRTSLKRHSISGGSSAAVSMLQAASVSSPPGSQASSPPRPSPPTKSLGRSTTLVSPVRPRMNSTISSPNYLRHRTQSLRSPNGHLKRRESASDTLTTNQYVTLEDVAAEAAQRDAQSPPPNVTASRRPSFVGQAPVIALTKAEPVQEPQADERTMSRSAAMRGGLEAKLVVLGSQGVGKTSLAYRYASGQFNPAAVPSTIGAAFLTKKLVVDNVNCRLQLWDTSGQEKWRAIAPMYYRGSHAALLVYDITSRRSFDDLKYWIDELKKNMGEDLIIHVVGAKSDLADSRQIEPHQAREQVLQWLHPERAAAIAASQASQTSAQSSVPMSKGTSRLSSLGNLAMESASRFATAFPSTGRSGGSVMKASDSSNGSGSGACSDSAGDATILLLPGDDNMNIEVSEVSSKDDRGIEEGESWAVEHGYISAPFDRIASLPSFTLVFLAITQKLVLRREEIEQRRLARERNSIFLHADQNSEGVGIKGRQGANDWSCC